MRKIAMYSTSQLFGNRITGGLKRFIELYDGLVEQNVSVDLYCSDSQDVLKKNNVDAFSLNFDSKSERLLIPTELLILMRNFKIVKSIKRKKYDQIIVFDVPTAISLCVLGIKNIQLFIRQDLISYKRISLKQRTRNILFQILYIRLMKMCEAICLLSSEKVIVQCHYDFNELLKRHLLIRKNIRRKTIIQINNVNPTWIVTKSKETKITSPKSIIKKDSNKFIIGFIGDFSNERKGHRVLIDSIKAMLDDAKRVEVLVMGDGVDLVKYKKECATYENIKFLGRVENPIKYLKICDLTIVPSLADSCPNTIMEALYNEVPVIGANSGGIPEILNNSNALFETNHQALKNKIKYCLDENNLSNLKEQQKIRKKELIFDWASVIINHLGLN